MHKLLVIGLDGAPYPLIKEWTRAGLLPNLANLIKNGSFGILNSTIPAHSPTAWSSFITGMNPGEHGIYDFVRRRPNTYQLDIVRANQIPHPSLWRILSEYGRQVGVMNVPMTYPPEEVNGFLLSGLGTPDYANYAYPPEMSKDLNDAGYRVNKKFFYDPDRVDEWLDDMDKVSDIRGKTAITLMREKPWDFFMVVFRNTDEICHFFWRHMDPTHPLHDPSAPDRYKNAILNLYQRIDKWVGSIVATAGPETNVIIMSDHGAGPLYKDVFLNEWLWRNGWLHFNSNSPKRDLFNKTVRRLGITRKNISNTLTRLNLHKAEVVIKDILGESIMILPRDDRPEFIHAVDWNKTAAYSFGYYGQIFVNLQGREPNGIIPTDDYLKLRTQIEEKLYQLTDPEDNKPVVDRVFKKEELYHGSAIDDAPDLLVIMRNYTYITRKGYEFAQKRGMFFHTPYTQESGSHRPEGILIASGPDIKISSIPLSTYDIQDLTPTLLYLCNCPIPETMNGQIIKEIIVPDHFTKKNPTYTNKMINPRSDLETIGQIHTENDQEIIDRLKKLGYLN